MELTASATTALLFSRSRNPPTTPFKASNLSNLHPPILNPKTISSNPKNLNKTPIFIPHCTKPTNTDGVDNVIKHQDPPIAPTKTQNPQKPISNQEKPPSDSSVSRGLVFDLGPEDSWDSGEVGYPVVKRFLSDQEERWFMWYYGRSGEGSSPGSIGLAVSSNGVHWERGKGGVQSSGDVGSVFEPSKDWWAFDTHAVVSGAVVVMSSSKIRAGDAVYWLYYTGFSDEKIESFDNSSRFRFQNPEILGLWGEGNGGVRQCLAGLAMSQDGRHWARIEGEDHTGALFDSGAEAFVASPGVVFHGSGDLRMYYHSFDAANGRFSVGVARSRDGVRWVKLGKVLGGGGGGGFDEYGAVSPCVMRKRDGEYLMAYEGVGADGGRSIGLAR